MNFLFPKMVLMHSNMPENSSSKLVNIDDYQSAQKLSEVAYLIFKNELLHQQQPSFDFHEFILYLLPFSVIITISITPIFTYTWYYNLCFVTVLFYTCDYILIVFHSCKANNNYLNSQKTGKKDAGFLI